MKVVDAVSEMPEIDVVHPILNLQGIGIMDGSVCGMERAIEAASLSGVGTYSMKSLGGGHLYREVLHAFTWVINHGYIDLVAIGIKTWENSRLSWPSLPDAKSLKKCLVALQEKSGSS